MCPRSKVKKPKEDKRLGDLQTSFPKLQKIEREIDINVIVHKIGGSAGEASRAEIRKGAEIASEIGAALSSGKWKNLDKV